MFASNPYEEVKDFKWEDLHRKVGILYFYPVTDSDMQEGHFLEQLVFATQDRKIYVLAERDIRKSK